MILLIFGCFIQWQRLVLLCGENPFENVAVSGFCFRSSRKEDE